MERHFLYPVSRLRLGDIDSTEALTAIDINSARATRGGDIEETAFNTNLEAADEIARQLRLRDLGGLIVIDFIDMTPVRHQRAVENRLREAVRQDRARIQISHISRFGLLEMSRQRLSPSLGESSHHVCPRCSGTGTVRDNESLSLSILRLIEEEALKENTQEVHAIVPVPIASYLLNEKRTAVNAIETRQNGVRCVIVPNDQMETPHYSVLRVRKGEETPTLSYLLPKLHEEAMELPSEQEYVERKQPEQPALATFAMPDVPPAPTVQEPAVKAAEPKAAATTASTASQPGLISRFFSALKSIFGGNEEAKPVEQPAPKTEEKTERQQDRRKPRQNNRRDRNDRRDNRNERAENGENRDDNRRNRRQAQQQNAEARDNRQQSSDVADKAKSADEQQTPRRERNRRRNDDKRQAQQEVKELNLAEQPAQDTEQEERVRQPQTRRKQRQLNQKVRYTDNAAVEAEVATAAVAAEVVVAQPVEQPVPAPRTELAKVDLPAVVAPEQEDNSEARDSNGMPRRSRRSPRHLRVSGQRRRRYRDERYPVQSPMPLTVACASPELASGKVWISYPVARPQDQQVEDQREQEIRQEQTASVAVEPQVAAAAVEHIVDTPAPVEAVQPEEIVAEPQIAVVETTHPEVIATPVEEQPQIIAESDAPVAEEIAAEEPAEIVVSQPEVVEEVVEVAPTVEEVAAPQEVVAAPVVEAEVVKPEVVKAEVVATSVEAEHLHSHATAPMTRAPAPDYVPEAPRHSDWQRPAFAFEGKGAAGGHSATHQATAPATRPQPVE